MVGFLSTKEFGSGEPPSWSDAPPEPPSLIPIAIGVAKERVDPRTLQLIEHLFPGHHGLDFLAKLLRQAQAKQLALPDLGLPEVCDVAVITAQSIRVLAQHLGLSYDTTEKYVVTFCQLRLLSKKRQRHQIILHFPLVHPHLPEPEALDQLQELRPDNQTPRYRPKVRTFASQVKRRFVLLRERGEITRAGRSQREASSSLAFQADDGPRLLLEDIRRVIGEEIDSETGKRLLLKIEGAFHYRCSLKPGLLSNQKGDSDADRASDVSHAYTKESPFHGKKVDSDQETSGQQSRLLEQKGDSQGCEKSVGLLSESPFCIEEGDSERRPTLQKGRLSPPKDDFQTPKGNSDTIAAGSGPPNVNVSLRNILESLNVNVGPVIEYLRTLFGEAPGKRGFYYNLHGKQCQDVEAWLAAAIETIVAISRQVGGVNDPGRYFYKRCIALHREGISPETKSLVQQYGPLTYPQLLEALRSVPKGPSTQHQASSAQGKSREPVIVLRIPRDKGQPGMSDADLKKLIALIRADEHTRKLKIVPYRQADLSGILLAEDWFGRQRWIYSLEEWQASFRTEPQKKTINSTSGKYHNQKGHTQ
ncbi:MAG TPA: hypothetical protein VKR06_14170 [Ktedonosporobacter sp.]|nr:hypothetical protein [Ktedonosporobacter sp.]